MTEETKEIGQTQEVSNKELNFRKLESEREKEKEQRIRLETELQMVRSQMSEIQNSFKPKEPDPFDDLDEYVDPEVKKRILQKFEKTNSSFEKRAMEIARQEYQKIQSEKEEEKRKDFLTTLRKTYSDYDEVMNEANLKILNDADPIFIEGTLQIQDEFKRRELAYKKIKTLKKEETKQSISDKVAQNQRNPYHIPSHAAPTSTAIHQDLNTRESREAAYKRLKDAQKNPIGQRIPS